MAWRDNEHVLFSASWMPSAQSILFPGDNQVYEVSIKGGRPRMFSTLPMEDISFANDGRMLYHDYKGYEDPFLHIRAHTCGLEECLDKGMAHIGWAEKRAAYREIIKAVIRSRQ